MGEITENWQTVSGGKQGSTDTPWQYNAGNIIMKIAGGNGEVAEISEVTARLLDYVSYMTPVEDDRSPFPAPRSSLNWRTSWPYLRSQSITGEDK